MVSLFVFRKLLKGWPLSSPGQQISWCPGHLFCIPAVSFFLGHGSQRVVLVFVLPFGSKCFAVLIQGRNNQALLVLSVNEGFFCVYICGCQCHQCSSDSCYQCLFCECLFHNCTCLCVNNSVCLRLYSINIYRFSICKCRYYF